MATWHDIETAAPELAATARGLLDAHQHKTIATLRRDGAPRISGSEATFVDGDLWWGAMWQSLKARDLQRDPRFALHSGSDDPPGWNGDAKVAGRAVEVDDDVAKAALVRAQGNGGGELGEWHLFRADITEVSVVRPTEAGDGLVIESWTAQDGLRRRRR